MFDQITGPLNASFIKKYIENAKGRAETLPSTVPKNVPKEHWWWFSKINDKNTDAEREN